MGGCYNGQLALFDTRKGSQPLEVTPVEISHKDPVHKLIFPSSKTGAYYLFGIYKPGSQYDAGFYVASVMHKYSIPA